MAKYLNLYIDLVMMLSEENCSLVISYGVGELFWRMFGAKKPMLNLYNNEKLKKAQHNSSGPNILIHCALEAQRRF